MVENLPAKAGDMGSIPGPGRSHTPRIRSLVQEDPIRHGATKSVHHSYGAHAPRVHAAQQEKHHKEKPMHVMRETHAAMKTQHSQK